MRILLVEDNIKLGRAINLELTRNSHVVSWQQDGKVAWQTIKTTNFDMILLDLGLPTLSGQEILRKTRGSGIATPIIILTVFGATVDKIINLDSGADDYLVKPLYLAELQARITAVHRRVTMVTSKTITARDITLDPSARMVTKSGLPITLPRREFDCLHLLMQRAGTVVSKDQLHQKLYGYSGDIASNAMEVHICCLRKKLDRNIIKTVRSVGYIFIA